MTTITIDEKLDINKKFKTIIDLYNYINENFIVEIEELENQDNIINSNVYKNYNRIISKIK